MSKKKPSTMKNGQKKEQCVTVVTITEETPIHAFEVRVEVFSDEVKAVAWIESDIDRLVTTYGLDRENDVDDWRVRLARDCSHAIQYECGQAAVR